MSSFSRVISPGQRIASPGPGTDGVVRVPAGHAHCAVRERHQHAALDDAAAVVVLRLGQERIEMVAARLARPKRTDQADEALVAIGLPTRGGGIEGFRCGGDGRRWLVSRFRSSQAFAAASERTSESKGH
jgi:hypothetical protein